MGRREGGREKEKKEKKRKEHQNIWRFQTISTDIKSLRFLRLLDQIKYRSKKASVGILFVIFLYLSPKCFIVTHCHVGQSK